MAGLVIHAVVYAAVNGLLIVLWALTTGSFEELPKVGQSPSDALATYNFWPIWVIASWGAGLVIHAGISLTDLVTGGPRRRRRRRRARAEMASHGGLSHGLEAMLGRIPAAVRTPPTPPSPPAPGISGRERVAVVFTDIAGSTDLAEQLGDEEWGSILAEHRRAVRAELAEHGGTEVGTQGDGFLMRFAAPGPAVACAVALQRRLERARSTGALTPQVRIGVHWGEANDDGGDLVGRVVNLAARVTAAAEPGEILVTEPVADNLPTAAGLEDRGLVPLRGVTQPRHLLAVRWREEDLAVPVSEGDART
jgi:class 3 adenylate cyclase